MHRPEMPLMMIAALQRRGVEPAAAARAAGDGAALLAHGGQVVAHGARLVHRQLGRERPAADARGVGLGDAQDVVQQPGPEARAGRRVAGHAVARGDVRVGAVVDVEQRALRAFEQQVGAGGVGLEEPVADVGHQRPQLLGGSASRRRAWAASASGCGAQHAGELGVVQLDAVRAAWPRSAAGASGPARAARGAPPCPRRPGRCPCRWCRSCRCRCSRAAPRGPGRARRGRAGSAGRTRDRNRRERTSMPSCSMRSISSSRCAGSTTTPLPM